MSETSSPPPVRRRRRSSAQGQALPARAVPWEWLRVDEHGDPVPPPVECPNCGHSEGNSLGLECHGCEQGLSGQPDETRIRWNRLVLRPHLERRAEQLQRQLDNVLRELMWMQDEE